MGPEVHRLRQYIPWTPGLSARPMSAYVLRFIDSRPFVRDYDVLWERYVKWTGLVEVSRSAGLGVRENRVVAKWPLRLREGAGMGEFEMLAASGHVGSERYVEWFLE